MKKSARYKVVQIFRLVLLLITCSSTSFAQGFFPPSDSLPDKTLPEATVLDSRPELRGYATWKPDSLPVVLPITLSDRLLWENAFDVRSNGPGVLTTMSLRGAGASRTPIYWNGLNLLSPMNGVIDLALIPVWSTDQLDVQFGGQSALQSSGAMGGSVQVVQGNANLAKGWQGSLQTAAGSFNRWDAGASLGWADQRFSSSARFIQVWAENDFPYQKQGLDGSYYNVNQPNNALHRFDFQQFNTWRFRPGHTISTSYWRQNAYRELPPSSTEAIKTTWQRDGSDRLVLQWDVNRRKGEAGCSKLAYLSDDLAFHLSGDTDTSKSRQLIWTTEYTWQIKNITWKTGLNAMRQVVQVDGYTDSTRWFGQTRLSAFGMGAWRWTRLRSTLLLRQEYAQDQAAPFSGSLGMEWMMGKVGSIQMHLARNFNLPTLNDRFWRNLGNVDLKPEKGYSADLGWGYQGKTISAGIRVYHLLVDDWILWQPDETGLFRPGNLRKVWGRGLEINFCWQKHWNQTVLSVSGRWQHSATTHVAVYGGSENVLGEQLAYTSPFSAGGNVKLRSKRFSMAYLQQFTGKRPDVVGKTLPAYTTGNLLGTYSLLQGKLNLEARVENLWNARYEIFRYRPMPGRSFRLGIALQLGGK